jgi:hypothetical protein
MGIDMVFKVIVLHKTIYHPLLMLVTTSVSTSLYLILHLILLSITEHLMFLLSFLFFFFITPQTKSAILTFPYRLTKDQFNRKLYISIALPECFKCMSMVLQLFDNDPFLLTLLTLLILSMQHVSFQTITNGKIPSIHIYAGLIFAMLIKLMIRRIFLNENDIFLLGIIS